MVACRLGFSRDGFGFLRVEKQRHLRVRGGKMKTAAGGRTDLGVTEVCRQ